MKKRDKYISCSRVSSDMYAEDAVLDYIRDRVKMRNGVIVQ